MKAFWAPYRLFFKFEARTSRQVMTFKDTYFIRLADDADRTLGIGECALFRGLSADDTPDYEQRLAEACADPEAALRSPCSSIRFGFECAMEPHRGNNGWLNGDYGIPLNGLVWMGDKATMRSRIASKLDDGFSVLKLKIGGIDFNDELDLLREVRRDFRPDDLEIRLDANGAFSPDDASERLIRLSEFGIHSIEQPIRAGQPEEMARICADTPVPVALDEELIGLRTAEESRSLIEAIRPQYIILKPSLCGGLRAADTYISIATELGIGWWATSALESNIGLAAIGSWLTDNYTVTMPQGLGTGQLYTNNIESPLAMQGGRLFNLHGYRWGAIDNLPWRH